MRSFWIFRNLYCYLNTLTVLISSPEILLLRQISITNKNTWHHIKPRYICVLHKNLMCICDRAQLVTSSLNNNYLLISLQQLSVSIVLLSTCSLYCHVLRLWVNTGGGGGGGGMYVVVWQCVLCCANFNIFYKTPKDVVCIEKSLVSCISVRQVMYQ